MKKIFPLQDPRHKPPRVVASIKSELRKYLKRERRKDLPEKADYWDFDCRAGRDSASAEPRHVSELIEAVDAAATENWEAVYIEILAKPGQRAPKKSTAAEGDQKKPDLS